MIEIPDRVNSKKQIEKCISGNQKAQKAFFYQYADLLYATLIRYVRESVVAEDLLIQAMMKIFSKLKDFTYVNDAALVAWMKKVAVTEALMHLRSDLKTVYKVEEISTENTISFIQDDERGEAELIETIELLPAGYRTVFLLYVVDGYSHREIAEKLEITEGTSRSQFFKARNLLQQKLKNKYGKSLGT